MNIFDLSEENRENLNNICQNKVNSLKESEKDKFSLFSENVKQNGNVSINIKLTKINNLTHIKN